MHLKLFELLSRAKKKRGLKYPKRFRRENKVSIHVRPKIIDDRENRLLFLRIRRAISGSEPVGDRSAAITVKPGKHSTLLVLTIMTKLRKHSMVLAVR